MLRKSYNIMEFAKQQKKRRMPTLASMEISVHHIEEMNFNVIISFPQETLFSIMLSIRSTCNVMVASTGLMNFVSFDISYRV